MEAIYRRADHRRAPGSPDMPIRELCGKHGIAQTTFHRWRNKFNGMQVSDARRHRALRGREAPCPARRPTSGLEILLVRLTST